jgi:hypothetical protein
LRNKLIKQQYITSENELTVTTPSFTSPNNVPITLASLVLLRTKELRMENITVACTLIFGSAESLNANASCNLIKFNQIFERKQRHKN